MDDPTSSNYELRLIGMRGDDEEDLEEERVEVFGNTQSPRVDATPPETEPDDDGTGDGGLGGDACLKVGINCIDK
uniref:Uncharacterized protein n=1 Tax=Leersia perrieri TaxID=77586 RepID=A0A0D9WV66_9ORYZ